MHTLNAINASPESLAVTGLECVEGEVNAHQRLTILCFAFAALSALGECVSFI